MEKSKTKKTVIEIISERNHIPVDEITEKSHLHDDLDMDSLDHIELIMDLENKLSISINDEKSNQLLTVQDIINEVDNQLNK